MIAWTVELRILDWSATAGWAPDHRFLYISLRFHYYFFFLVGDVIPRRSSCVLPARGPALEQGFSFFFFF